MNNNRKKTVTITTVGLMTALICAIAPITIPLPSGIPLSLATLLIYISVYILGLRLGTISVLMYICIGALGLPVFSGFSGGFGKLSGPTGGYIVGYIFMALICGAFLKIFSEKRLVFLMGMITGTIICYTLGTVWYALITRTSITNALIVCVIPFIIGDILKISIGLIITPIIRKRLIRSGILHII